MSANLPVWIRCFVFVIQVTLLPVAAFTIGEAQAGDNQENAKLIKITTSLGVIEVELNEEKAPETVKNFLEYVNSGFYDGTLFHRVVPGFVIQGGGFEAGMKEKSTRDPITNEADNGLPNVAGSLSMARTNDPHSASSQFFINLKNNDFLNHREKSPAGWGYAVFAQVTSGMNVVEQIAGVATQTVGPYGDVPTEDVVMIKVEVVDTP